ncbi:MAG: D-2-hydroxyacid dehydrogenase [Chloroflexi bacterium]|nr:D-2-hydroxyacid dehydrogenase [Chloroflexota bacterium]
MIVIVPDFLVERLAPDVARVAPGARTIGIDADGRTSEPPTGAVALLRYFPNDRVIGAFGGARIAELLREAPTLSWVQSHGAGIDGLLSPELIESDAVLCNAASIHAVPMAETVMALILAATKRIPEHAVDQHARVWRRLPKRELRGSTVGIVGLGRIGTEVARLCAAFEARVLGLRRTPPPVPPPGVERVYDVAGLPTLLRAADYVVLTLSLNPTSRGLIGSTELQQMKSGAVLVNVARGDVVDEPALVDALREGRLGYACLDTFHQEPLPSDSPLYDLPNVLITPHNSASSPHMEERVLALFLDNLGRLVRGEPLLNAVDKQRG